MNGHSYAKAKPYLVDPDTGCWVWQRAITGPKGSVYGVIKRNGKRIKAHRFFYEKFKGPIPDGYYMDHLCHNHMCVNPDHLEPVTPAENVRRGRLTKLTIEDAREIRRLAGTCLRKELAARYGVSYQVITTIILGKAWKE